MTDPHAPRRDAVHRNPARDPAWTTNRPDTAVQQFHRELPGYAPTPLIDLPALAEELGVGHVLAKDESHRLGLPAFKGLGASWAIAQTVQEHASDGRRLTLVTATDGNHGRAVARFARQLGHHAHVLVPQGVHPDAVQAIRDEGARVTTVDGTYDDAVTTAAELADDDGSLLVQDTAWPGYERIPSWIVEGYSTLFAELDEQLDTLDLQPPDLLLVPTGVGSLLQAALTHTRGGPDPTATTVLAVEPTVAACVTASITTGRPTSVRTGETIMSGMNCGTVSDLAWPLIRPGLDATVTVTDDTALEATRSLHALDVQAGPCGAATLAAARTLRDTTDDLTRDSTIVLLVTESIDANPAGAA